MANFDDEFVGIEESAYDPEKPVDAWLRQRTRANFECVQSRRHPVVTAYQSGGQVPDSVEGPSPGDRPWVSPTRWAYPVVIPYLLQSTSLGADVQMSVSAHGDAGVDLESSIWIVNNGQYARLAQGRFSGPYAKTFRREDCNAIADNPFGNSKEYGQLRVGLRSQVGGKIENLILQSTGQPRIVEAKTPALVDYGSAPELYGPDVSVIVTTDGSVVDILGADEGDNTYYLDTDFFPYSIIASETTVARNSVGWLQVRSIGINPVYAPGHVDRVQLQARQVESGESATGLASQTLELHRRPQLLFWGGSGYRPSESSNPSNIPTRFRVVNATSGGTLLNEAVYWRRGSGGTIEVAMYCILTANGLTEESTASWDFTVALGRPNSTDTSWSSPVNLFSKTVTYTAMRTIPSKPVYAGQGKPYAWDTPFIRTHNWIRGQNGTVPNLSAWAYGHREGQLYTDDFQHLSLVTLTLNIPNIPDDYLGALRVSAQYVDDSLDAVDRAKSKLGYRHCLHVIGYSGWGSR